jgi:hypothetical protein
MARHEYNNVVRAAGGAGRMLLGANADLVGQARSAVMLPLLPD